MARGLVTAKEQKKSKMLHKSIEIGIRIGKIPLIRHNFFNVFFFSDFICSFSDGIPGSGSHTLHTGTATIYQHENHRQA